MKSPEWASATVGQQGLRVPRVGLGTGLHGEVSEAQSVATIEHALGCGVRFFDTAPLYGNGLAEERLGIALRGVPRDSYVLNTKVGILSGGVTGGFDYDFSAPPGWSAASSAACAASAPSASTSCTCTSRRGSPSRFCAKLCRLVAGWREQGLIRAVSAGVNHWHMVEPFVQHLDCVLLAGRYTLLEQTALPFLERQRQARRPVLGAGIFNSGILATGPRDGARYNYVSAPRELQERVRHLQQVCGRHGVELAHAAVQFVSAQPAIAALIFGACSPAELDQALAGTRAATPPALWAELRTAGLLDPAAPVPA